MTPLLEAYGWTGRLADAFAAAASPGEAPARVVKQTRGGYGVMTERGVEERARLAGPLGRAGGTARPAVGDWVSVLRKSRDPRLAIQSLLPRTSAFVRLAAGAVTQGQVVAANVDLVFLVMGLDGDFNLRRLERYLTLAWDSGARPIVVLNKADLCADPETPRAQVASVSPDVDVLVVSGRLGEARTALGAYLPIGVTGAFLGSSGVGKSTLVNGLAGEALMRTGATASAQGRHTTSHRQLLLLPGGGMVIDTPGMRELQLWAEADGLSAAFAEVMALACQCRFRDCSHGQEPGCAVRQAVAEGRLSEDRLRSYESLRGELGTLSARQAEAHRIGEHRQGQRLGRKRDG